MDTDTKNFLGEVDAYCRAIKIERRTLSSRVLGHGAFFLRMGPKWSPSLRSAGRFRSYIAKNPPPTTAKKLTGVSPVNEGAGGAQ